MYQDASKLQLLLNLSWDLIVIAILLVSTIYIFGNIIISVGIPQFYVEKYVLTLTCSVIGYQAMFSVLFFLSIKEKVKMFGIPVIDLSALGYKNFLLKIVTYTSSSTFILFFFIIFTLPFLTLFHKYFGNDVELRHNRILITPYLKTLLVILFVTVLILFTGLSF